MEREAAGQERFEELTERELAELRAKAVRSLRRSLEEMTSLIESPEVARSVKIKVAHAIAQTCGVLGNLLKAMGMLEPGLDKEAKEFAEWLMGLRKQPKKWIKDPDKLKAAVEIIIEIVKMLFDALKRRKPLELRVLELERRVKALEEKMGGK